VLPQVLLVLQLMLLCALQLQLPQGL